MDKEYKLSLLVTASTSAASRAVKGLETQLEKLSRKGGAGGFLAGFGGTALTSLQFGLSAAGRGISLLGQTGMAVFRGLWGGMSWLAGGVKAILGGAFSLVTGTLKTMGIAAAATAGAVYAAVKAMGPASFMEDAMTQMIVLLGSADKAKARMAWIKDFEMKTPFDIKQLTTAANLMESFGVFSKRNLTAFGNAASAFRQQITDIIMPMSKLRQGLFEGESLGRFGITRQALKGEGVQFGKQGNLLTPGPEAFEATIRFLEKRFGGLMSKTAQNWSGLLSTISSRWFQLWANFGEGALKYGKGALKAIIDTFDFINAKIRSIDWRGPGNALLIGFTAASALVKDLFDPARRKAIFADVATFGKGLWDAAKMVPEALLQSLGGTLDNFFTNFGTLASNFADVLKAAFEFGAAALEVAVGAMSEKFKWNIGLGVEKMLQGKGVGWETTKADIALQMQAAQNIAGRAAPGSDLMRGVKTPAEAAARLGVLGQATGRDLVGATKAEYDRLLSEHWGAPGAGRLATAGKGLATAAAGMGRGLVGTLDVKPLKPALGAAGGAVAGLLDAQFFGRLEAAAATVAMQALRDRTPRTYAAQYLRSRSNIGQETWQTVTLTEAQAQAKRGQAGWRVGAPNSLAGDIAAGQPGRTRDDDAMRRVIEAGDGTKANTRDMLNELRRMVQPLESIAAWLKG